MDHRSSKKSINKTPTEFKLFHDVLNSRSRVADETLEEQNCLNSPLSIKRTSETKKNQYFYILN